MLKHGSAVMLCCITACIYSPLAVLSTHSMLLLSLTSVPTNQRAAAQMRASPDVITACDHLMICHSYVTDINECANNNGGCAQTCTNTAGSYQCSCGTGFTLNSDEHACDGKTTNFLPPISISFLSIVSSFLPSLPPLFLLSLPTLPLLLPPLPG